MTINPYRTIDSKDTYDNDAVMVCQSVSECYEDNQRLRNRVAFLEGTLCDVDHYLESIAQWFEGDSLPSEHRCKELLCQIGDSLR